jgi:hypothetical protein
MHVGQAPFQSIELLSKLQEQIDSEQHEKAEDQLRSNPMLVCTDVQM